jgi:plastocyanin
MLLPRGYGYPTRASDNWGLTAMVMNHRLRADKAFIEYKVTYDTDPAIKPVKPIWMDVENCRSDPVYDVPGGKPRGAVHRRTSTWTAPEPGRLVAGGGHVHGGAKSLRLSQPACGDRTLYTSRPLWGKRDHPFYRVKPVLHEPGPVSMSGTLTEQGYPLAKGEEVKLTSSYDAELPHTRVMGISVNYFAPDPTVTEQCGAPPTDAVTAQMRPQPGRKKTPRVTVPLTGLNRKGKAVHVEKPRGRTRRGGRTNVVAVRDFAFAKPNLRVPRGARVRWAFGPQTLHNVTLASGPRGFSSPNLSLGRTYEKRLTKRGTYKLFCGLHPVSMTQRIVVR